MISLITKDDTSNAQFELTCDHDEPIIYNTYEGSFSKDYIQHLKNEKIISLFNRYDFDLLKERVEDNGSSIEVLLRGVRVAFGRGSILEENRNKLPFADAIFSSLERYIFQIFSPKGNIHLNVHNKQSVVPFNLINVLFSVKGTVNFLVCVSLNEALSTFLLKRMIEEEGIHHGIHELIIDSISEMCNTVVGNAFRVFENCEGEVRLGVPIVFRFSQDEILESNIPIKFGELQLDSYSIKVMVLDLG